MQQVGNVDMLNCYYAHADCSDGLQVRVMLQWLLINLAEIWVLPATCRRYAHLSC